MKDLFSMVNEPDQSDLHACFNYLYDYMQRIPPEQHNEYRSVLHYRIRKETGQLIYVHDEKAVINLSGSGNLYFALLRDITSEKRFEGVKIEIFKQQESLVKLKEFKPVRERTQMTKREADLMTLIKQGLSTKEIAWYLNISHHTVRNTKSKLFEKYKVNNTVELLNMTA
jgi:DNA-binding CsgD family transcriptional regulator